ncbi:MAG: hypothetical protein WEB52_05150 [Dehalococcoidia bacterium]
MALTRYSAMALRFIAGLALTCVMLIAGPTVASAQEPSPTSGAPQTPAPGAPSPPTELAIAFGESISWSDNSADEAGFRLRYRLSGEGGASVEFVYEVPADTTTFMLPPGAPRICDDGYYALMLSIVAFNERGESAFSDTGRTVVIAECAPPAPSATAPAPETTPALQTTLPSTGLRAATSSWRSTYLQAMIASFVAAALVLGLALRAGSRRR